MKTDPQTSVTTQSTPQASGRIPRWAVAAIVLQSLTLLCLFASNGTTPASANAQFGQSREDSRTPPNAAQQRAEQTKMLGKLVSELEKTNSRLDSIDKYLRSGDLEVRQAAQDDR